MSVRKQRPNETDEEYAARRERYRLAALRYRQANREKVRAASRRLAEKLSQDPDRLEKRRAQNRARSNASRAKNREAVLARERARRKDPDRKAARLLFKQARDADPARYERHKEMRRLAYHRQNALPEGHDGACELCGKTPPPRRGGRHGLNEDHRHDTGEVRGLICTRCNSLVGALDLRFTDPGYFEKLTAWSNRAAPPIGPTKAKRPGRRERRKQPQLFDTD